MAEPREATGRKTPALRLRLSAAAESAIRRGHPWVFAESILEQNRAGQNGELGIVYDRQDLFLAIGLYDPDSPLRLRVLHSGKPEKIDLQWWSENLRRALAKRDLVADEGTNGYRCINGESDHWPGLVLDRYAGTHVLKLYTSAWLVRLDEICELISDQTRPERIVLRLSRNIQAIAREQFSRGDGTVIRGPAVNEPVIFSESGLQFEAEVLKGQKTGFFLDQRENRRRVETLAAGREVLNAFSFSGGFSLYAARGGARSVTDLDISAHALNSARRNFQLNHALPAVAACQHNSVQADVFDWLGGNPGQKFDLIILDPPSLAKREAERARALDAYGSLATLALDHLRSRGLLVACSCSAHVQAEDFFSAVTRAAGRTGRKFEELARTFHAPDHPATFKEAEYLKGIYLRFQP